MSEAQPTLRPESAPDPRLREWEGVEHAFKAGLQRCETVDDLLVFLAETEDVAVGQDGKRVIFIQNEDTMGVLKPLTLDGLSKRIIDIKHDRERGDKSTYVDYALTDYMEAKIADLLNKVQKTNRYSTAA